MPQQSSMPQDSTNQAAEILAARHVVLERASLAIDCITRATAALERSSESAAGAANAFKSVAAHFLRQSCVSVPHIKVRIVEHLTWVTFCWVFKPVIKLTQTCPVEYSNLTHSEFDSDYL